MKIQSSTESTQYLGFQESLQESTKQAEKVERTASGQMKSVDASSLNLGTDEIAKRREQAKKQAMNVVMDQFRADSKIDQDLSKRRQTIADEQDKAKEALSQIKDISQQEEQLKEDWGITDDSREQQELELRLKVQEAMKPGSDVELTKEEWEQYSQLGEPSDYQQIMLGWEAEKDFYQADVDAANKEIATQTQVIRATKQELLKYHGMDDAMDAAEDMREAASKEIFGMLIQEGMDKIKDQIDQAVEQGEKQKEEKEETQALRQEQKSQEEQQNQQVESQPDTQQIQDDVEQKIQEILAKQKLLEEDLKGVQVDSTI